MNRTQQPTILLLILVISAVFGFACNGSNSGGSPTNPGGVLLVEVFSTGTQSEPQGGRVQLRLRVVGGRTSLGQAATNGSANARVCLSASCVDDPISLTFSEAVCAGLPLMPAGNAGLGIGAAWLGDDVVGIDFCIADLPDGGTFSTTVSDGVNLSNTIQTTCVPDSGGLFCASD